MKWKTIIFIIFVILFFIVTINLVDTEIINSANISSNTISNSANLSIKADGKGIDYKYDWGETNWTCNSNISAPKKSDGIGWQINGEALLSTGGLHNYTCYINSTDEFLLYEETRTQWYYEDGTPYDPAWRNWHWGNTTWNGTDWVSHYTISPYANMSVYSVNYTTPVLINIEDEDERIFNNLKQQVYSFNGIECDRNKTNCDWELSKDKKSFRIDFIAGDSFYTNSVLNLTGCGATLTANNFYTMNASLSCAGHGVTIGGVNVTLDMKNFILSHSDTGNADYGINNAGGHHNLSVLNGTIRDFARGLNLADGDFGNFTDLHIDFGQSVLIVGAIVYGVFMGVSNMENTFRNIEIHGMNGGSGKAARNIYGFLMGGNEHFAYNTYIHDITATGSTANGIRLENSNINWFIDGLIENINADGPGVENEVHVVGDVNNNFLNITYTTEFVNTVGTNSLKRWWRYNVFVNDSNGNPVVADVNSSGTNQGPGDDMGYFHVRTNASGMFDEKEMVREYRRIGATKGFYNYVITATNTSFLSFPLTSDYNATIEQNNLKDNFQFPCWRFTNFRLSIFSECLRVDIGGIRNLISDNI